MCASIDRSDAPLAAALYADCKKLTAEPDNYGTRPRA